ncbi:hypothetical protein MMC11_004821 [Xylographa trunciseda]|nr:hypothetical protein [Xylographa trunciseda]
MTVADPNILDYNPLKAWVLHITFLPGKTMSRPVHAYTHSVSLSHKLAMEAAEDYIAEVRDHNLATNGLDHATFHRDAATELKAGWTLAYWATMKTQIHVTLKITEMLLFPTDLFDVESSGSSGDADVSDGS